MEIKKIGTASLLWSIGDFLEGKKDIFFLLGLHRGFEFWVNLIWEGKVYTQLIDESTYIQNIQTYQLKKIDLYTK